MEVFSSITNGLNRIVNHSSYLIGTSGVLAGLMYGQYWTIKQLRQKNEQIELLRTELQQSTAKLASKEAVEDLKKQLQALSERIDNLKIEDKIEAAKTELTKVTSDSVDQKITAAVTPLQKQISEIPSRFLGVETRLSDPRTPTKPSRSKSFTSSSAHNPYLPDIVSPNKNGPQDKNT
jgi:hypothetical protein